jgi:hypothetical protein
MTIPFGGLCGGGAHRQHRCSALAHDTLGDTSQNQMFEPSPAMRRHDHEIRSEPLLRGNDQIAGLPNFDGQLTPYRRRNILRALFEPAPRVLNLRIVKVFAGVSLGRSLRGQRIYLQDVQQIESCTGTQRKRRGVSQRINRVEVEVNRTKYFAMRERQSRISLGRSSATCSNIIIESQA